jgi:hypothetical protein
MKSSLHSPNSFLVISSQSSSTAISRGPLNSNSIHPPPYSDFGRLASRNWFKQPFFSPFFITARLRLHRKHRSSVAWIRLRGNMLTQSLHSNGCTRQFSYHDSPSIVACGHCLTTAVSLAPLFRLSGVMSQYIGPCRFIHSFIHSSMALQPFVGTWRLFQFRNRIHSR